MRKKRALAFAGLLVLIWLGFFTGRWDATAISYRLGISKLDVPIGGVVDSFNGVDVYYNGPVRHSEGINSTPEGYVLGTKWQNTEFVNRYYYQAMKHVMPDSGGYAYEYFDGKVRDGEFNTARGLWQYVNGGISRPMVGDILVFDWNMFSHYGHVAIVTEVTDTEVGFIHQNPGPAGPFREHLDFTPVKGEPEMLSIPKNASVLLPPGTVNGTLPPSFASQTGEVADVFFVPAQPGLDSSGLLGWLRKDPADAAANAAAVDAKDSANSTGAASAGTGEQVNEAPAGVDGASGGTVPEETVNDAAGGADSGK